MPLEGLLDGLLADRTDDKIIGEIKEMVSSSPQLMLKSITEGIDNALKELYGEATTLIAAQGGSLEGFMVGQDNSSDDAEKADANRPRAFYQVAIDVAGFGNTGGSTLPSFADSEFLTEVITSLGKEYAFAIVAFQQAAISMLTNLLAKPRLCSFLLLREPLIDDLDIDRLHSMLHPTLIPWDPDGNLVHVKTVRNLNSVLPQVSSHKVSLAANPKFYQADLARVMMEWFSSHEWHGAMAGFGDSQKLALLTRLAGGFDAWRGERRGSMMRESRMSRRFSSLGRRKSSSKLDDELGALPTASGAKAKRPMSGSEKFLLSMKPGCSRTSRPRPSRWACCPCRSTTRTPRRPRPTCARAG